MQKMKKTSVQSNINLETLAGGAFAEKLNEALMQVAENIQNPNTEATTKRQIQITLKFAPNKTRQLVSTQIAVTTKLAATEAIDTQMIMGVNMRTGQIEIAEYDGQPLHPAYSGCCCPARISQSVLDQSRTRRCSSHKHSR
jgi:hypothetical protein